MVCRCVDMAVTSGISILLIYRAHPICDRFTLERSLASLLRGYKNPAQMSTILNNTAHFSFFRKKPHRY